MKLILKWSKKVTIIMKKQFNVFCMGSLCTFMYTRYYVKTLASRSSIKISIPILKAKI